MAHLNSYLLYVHPQLDGVLLSHWTGTQPTGTGLVPASHLAQLDAMETKAFKIIGISNDEAECIGPITLPSLTGQ